jgi:hypothetical protein
VADQTGSGTLTDGAGVAEVSPHGIAGDAHHHGRPISWIAVTIVTIGFIVGGIAMVPGPKWWLFWTGTGIAVVGCLMIAVARTFDTDWY